MEHMKHVVWSAWARGISLCVIILLSPSLSWAQGAIDAPLDGNTRTGAFQVAGFFCLPDGLEPADVTITMSFDGGPEFPVSYGNERGDTAGVCAGETRNGFVAQWNYNILGTGPHTVMLSADIGAGPEVFASSSFNVVTLGQEFAVGLSRPFVTVNNWPNQGDRVQLRWEQGIQNWTLVNIGEENVTGEWLFSLSFSSTSGQCGALSGLFTNINMELDIVEGTAGEGGRPFSGKLREVETAAHEGLTFNVNGLTQANSDFTFETDTLTNTLADDCTQFVSMTGSGNFTDRSVDEASLLISTQNCPEEQTVNCTARYNGSISLP